MEKNSEKDPDVWLKEKEVAEEFGCSMSWLQKKRRPGMKGIPYRKLDHDNPKSQVRYRRRDCLIYFEGQMIDPRAA